jgi:hypothetical protein
MGPSAREFVSIGIMMVALVGLITLSVVAALPAAT